MSTSELDAMLREYLKGHWKAYLPHLKATPSRFPLALAAALAFSAVLVLNNHNFSLFDDRDVLTRSLSFCVIAYFLFLAGHILGEGRAWPRPLTILLTLAAGGLLAWRVVTAEHVFWRLSGVDLFLLPACVLAVMAAAYVQVRQADDALWHFNRLVWFGCAFGLLVGFVLGGGISSAFKALEVLFGLKVPNDLYKDVWAVSLGLAAPWLALAAVPRSFAAPDVSADKPLVSGPIAFLASYILVPLAIAYFAILYAFMVKIAVLWELPQGKVAALTLGYAAFGVATHLIAYPLRETGPGHVRTFRRWFYPAMIASAVLLALAIGVRVEAYGITEHRYLVMTFAAWLLLLAPFMTLRPTAGLKVAPLSLAVLLALGSFGPWGAEALSKSSQMARLEAILVRNDLLQDGHIVPAEEGIGVPREDAVQISSIVAYLRRSGQYRELAPWFEGSELDFAAKPQAREIVGAIGVPYVFRRTHTPTFYLHAQQDSRLASTAGFEQVGYVRIVSHNDRLWQETLGPDANGESYDLSFQPRRGELVIVAQDGATLELDLNALVAQLREKGLNRKVENLSLEARKDPLRARLVFQHLSGTLSETRPYITNGSVLVLIDRTDR